MNLLLFTAKILSDSKLQERFAREPEETLHAEGIPAHHVHLFLDKSSEKLAAAISKEIIALDLVKPLTPWPGHGISFDRIEESFARRGQVVEATTYFEIAPPMTDPEDKKKLKNRKKNKETDESPIYESRLIHSKCDFKIDGEWVDDNVEEVWLKMKYKIPKHAPAGDYYVETIVRYGATYQTKSALGAFRVLDDAAL